MPIKIREEVIWFAEEMELKLRANDEKGGWDKENLLCLVERLEEELEELKIALVGEDAMSMVYEAADVGNFAMMIAVNAIRDVKGYGKR